MSLGFPNLRYTTDYYKSRTPVELPPLDQEHKTCETLNKEWKGELQREWHNCITDNPLKKEPSWENLKDDEKQAKINAMCCEEVLQCNNPNQWLKKHNYNVTCANLGNPPPFPHFADIRPVKHSLFGVK